MKPRNVHLSIAMRETPSFARPLSPGCPTDSVGTFTDVTPLWTAQAFQPRTTSSREPSWTAATSSMGPPVSTTWRIEPGTFVAFSLDTQTIANQFPEDSAIYRAVLAFAVGRYAGLVTSSYAYHPEDGTGVGTLVEELIVNYIGCTPPPVNDLRTHALPIHPSTKLDWESPPLKTTTLFPWQDRFQWTTLGTRLQIINLVESNLKFELSEDDFARFEDKVAGDYPEMTTRLARAPESAEDEALVRLQVPMFSLPVKVWRDVREADRRDDPTAFAAEVLQLDALCNGQP